MNEIVSAIGAGGMGEVYKARDTRLDRTVAIKVLPEHVASDPDLKQRFEREAKTISSLNHPHICTLYDIGSQDGIDFLVMEYLEGDTLAQRLEKGALRLDQALKVAIEIADALDKAHRQGITHRDLKPGNIMLTKAGAKLLDFGLAKLKGPDQAAEGLTALPTQDAPLTQQGAILGTFQYMAPEQLEGQEADARTDIFAFGAVIYEMVTGRRAFEGKSQASLIAAIMHVDPPALSTLQPITPPALDHAVRTCLAKDADRRWQTVGDVGRQLQWITEDGSQVGVPAVVATPRKTREWLAWATAAAIALLALVLAVLNVNRAPDEGDMVRFSVPTGSREVRGLALSPDGTQLAFVAGPSGAAVQMWVRPLDSVEARALPGTEGAASPFWSPDGRSIGFFTETELRTIDLAGGPPQTVCANPEGGGGTWNEDNVIVFGSRTGLFQVPAGGGEPTRMTTVDGDRGETFHGYPQFLPDGESFLFHVEAPEELEAAGIYVGSLEPGATPSLLLRTNNMAQHAAPGYLLVGRGTSLVMRRFDVERLAITGDPVRVAEGVRMRLSASRGGRADSAGFSTSHQGNLAYMSAVGPVLTQWRWLDRSGTNLGTVGDPGDENAVLSPDETRIAVERDGDIWLLDNASGSRGQRFTFDTALDIGPIWSPDGDRIVFSSLRDGRPGDLYEKEATGASEAQLLLETNSRKEPFNWSADFVSYNETQRGIWLLGPMSGDYRPTSFLQTPFYEDFGVLSPDGRWMAYTSNESGEFQVVVQGVPPSGGKWEISTTGGTMARWRADGRELYYVSLDGELMAVDVEAVGDTLERGTIPQPLFPLSSRIPDPDPRNVFDVTADGQRFLVNTLVEGPGSTSITWVLNWTADLEE